MQKGDIVIAEHPDSKSNRLMRNFGIVHEVTKAGSIIIEMADGSMIKRQANSVAVFTKIPSNWQDLYEQQIVLSQPRQRWIGRGLHTKQQQN
ncbi:MAG: hypothetical protein GY799_13010 [Desulfobulbaceae bacterium]|nr:hypothetical protein [Desulfobulbaceae bacterium]